MLTQQLHSDSWPFLVVAHQFLEDQFPHKHARLYFLDNNMSEHVCRIQPWHLSPFKIYLIIKLFYLKCNGTKMKRVCLHL